MYDAYSSELMIKTYFGCEISDIAKDVIITPIWKLNKFIEYAQHIEKEFEGWYNGATVIFNNKPITILNSGIGSPLAGDCVLALKHSNCEHIYFSGSAGAIKSDLSIGDILAVDEAVIGEGFSRYHQGNIGKDCFGALSAGDESIADRLLDSIKRYNEALGISVRKGRIFTIDSILGETREVFDFMLEKGCDAVEMEVSSVFTASRKIGRKAAALILISDLPLNERSLYDGISEDEKNLFKNMRERIPELLMEAATSGLEA